MSNNLQNRVIYRRVMLLVDFCLTEKKETQIERSKKFTYSKTIWRRCGWFSSTIFICQR